MMLSKTPNLAIFLMLGTESPNQMDGGMVSSLMVLKNIKGYQPLLLLNRRDTIEEKLKQEGIPYQILNLPYPFNPKKRSLLSKIKLLLSLFISNIRVWKFLRHNKNIKIFQCDDRATALVCLAPWLTGAKLVVVARNYPNIAPVFRWKFKLPMAFADVIIATSKRLYDSIKKQRIKRKKQTLHLIYNSISLEEVRTFKEEHSRETCRKALGLDLPWVIMGIVGHVYPIKKQKDFIEKVLPLIKDDLIKYNGYVYIIGGIRDAHYKQACEKLLKSMGMEERVRFVGYTEKIFLWYGAMDFLLYPGIAGVNRCLIEAQSFDLPVVAFQGCEEAFLPDVSGFVCQSYEEMANYTLLLLKDKKLRWQMGRRGYALVEEKFGYANNVKKYEEIYNVLMKNAQKKN